MAKLGRDQLWMIIKKALFIWAGICLIAVGLVGMILPIFPGVIPLAIGVILIAKGSRRFRKHHYVKSFLMNIRQRLKKQKGWIAKLSSFF